MNGDGSIRPGAADPVTTRANVGPARRVAERCAHGLVCWLIGAKREPWHVAPADDGLQLLVECDAPQGTYVLSDDEIAALEEALDR